MRPLSPRDVLAEPAATATPGLAAARDTWAQVRAGVAEIRELPAGEAEHRMDSLRASSDPVAQQIVELLDLRVQAEGFLEPPPPLPRQPPPSLPGYSSGQLVGPYRIVSVLGEGGMGRVYRAEDTRLLRPVALKVLTPHRVRGASLLREARMAARLHHANIATIHDVLEVDGHLHIVMEYLQGRSLSRVLADEALTVDRVTTIFSRMLAAVRHAHDSGVIHCDLKPGNVFVLEGDDIKVLDFGLARLDAAGPADDSSMAVAGTPRFMAPERVFGAHPSAGTDIYSLGVILADMLRRLPATPLPEAATTRVGGVADDGRRDALQAVARRAMADDPDDRFHSVAEMMQALDATTRPAQPAGIRPGTASIKWLIASLVLALASGLLVAVVGVTNGGPPPHATIAVNLSAAAGDPFSAYVAAAMQQVIEHAMMSAPDVTVVRQPSAGSSSDELGATHVLAGTVERAGEQVHVVLSLTDRDGAVLASRQVSTPLSALSSLEPSLLTGVDAVLARSGLALDRRAITEASTRRVLTVDPQGFEEYAQAREYMRSPEVPDYLDHAITLLTRAVSRDGSFGLAYAGLAEAYWQKYQATRDTAWTDRARAAALDALRLNPDDPIVRYTLALIYRGMGRRDEALNEVSKAIALQPSNDDLFRMRGRLHADLGRIDLALSDLNTALRLRPGYWDNHRTAGLVLYEVGRYDEAIPYFSRVTELRPSNASAFQALGTAYHAANRIPEALTAYESALALAPNANTYSNLGLLHYANGAYAQARHAYEESIRLRPKEPITHRNLGDTLRKLALESRARAEYERAIVLAQESLEVNPSDLEALSLQALCHAKLDHRDQAAALAREVLRAPSLAAAARYRAAVALVLAGVPDGTREVVQALNAGYSRSVAAQDDDLASVRNRPEIAAALAGQAGK